jgi:predicted nucleic acid-binding protein
MKNKTEFLVETDIILNHFTQEDTSVISDLELAMSSGNCFTSVITASELYFLYNQENERLIIDSVIYALKVLGIHPRYCLNISEFFNKVATTRDALICSLAKNNKLPILTNDVSRFIKSGIKIISPNQLRG